MADINAPAQHNELERQRMLKAVAAVTLEWAEVENMCVFLLRQILAHGHMGIASAIWFAPTNLETRLTILDRAFCEFVRNEEHEDRILRVWASTMNTANRLKSLRNKVAHGQIVVHRTNGKNYIRLTAPLLDNLKFRESRRPKQLPGVSAHDLERSFRSVLALADRMRDIANLARFTRMGNTPALLETLAQLEVDRPS
jgi:hypothetical protein